MTLNVTHTNQVPTCTGGPFEYEVESGQVLSLPDPPCTDADGETLTLRDRHPARARHARRARGRRRPHLHAGRRLHGRGLVHVPGLRRRRRVEPPDGDITVTPPPNDPPACSDVSRPLVPDAAATIQLACTDPDGDPVTLEPVAGPAHGTLGAIDQSTDQVVYTPEASYTGTDSFTYRATDGTLPGPAATVSIVVTGAPTCENVARTTEIGAAISVPLTCTDPDGDPLTLSIVGSPSKGTLN